MEMQASAAGRSPNLECLAGTFTRPLQAHRRRGSGSRNRGKWDMAASLPWHSNPGLETLGWNTTKSAFADYAYALAW